MEAGGEFHVTMSCMPLSCCRYKMVLLFRRFVFLLLEVIFEFGSCEDQLVAAAIARCEVGQLDHLLRAPDTCCSAVFSLCFVLSISSRNWYFLSSSHYYVTHHMLRQLSC